MSKDPNNRVLGPKYYNVTGIWDESPIVWVLGPLGTSIVVDMVIILPRALCLEFRGMPRRCTLGGVSCLTYGGLPAL